jgi:hypothetical protein
MNGCVELFRKDAARCACVGPIQRYNLRHAALSFLPANAVNTQLASRSDWKLADVLRIC